jgi:hypothetical protein
MAKKRKTNLPILNVRKGATMREIYARARSEFTADDLQKYTVDEPMIPADEVMKELEAIHSEETAKASKKK